MAERRVRLLIAFIRSLHAQQKPARIYSFVAKEEGASVNGGGEVLTW